MTRAGVHLTKTRSAENRRLSVHDKTITTRIMDMIINTGMTATGTKKVITKITTDLPRVDTLETIAAATLTPTSEATLEEGDEAAVVDLELLRTDIMGRTRTLNLVTDKMRTGEAIKKVQETEAGNCKPPPATAKHKLSPKATEMTKKQIECHARKERLNMVRREETLKILNPRIKGFTAKIKGKTTRETTIIAKDPINSRCLLT